MSRGLASAITTELAKGQFMMAHLVSLELNSTWLFTDAPVNISPGGATSYNYMLTTTAGSSSASLSGPADITDMLFPQLIAGMLVSDISADYEGIEGAVSVGTTIASLGTAPYFTLSNQAIQTRSTLFAKFTGAFTYLANGFLLGLDTVKESSNINIGSFSIGISAVNQSLISDVLNNGHLNKKVIIKRIFLDSNTYEPIGGASSTLFSVYSGRIEGMNIRESGDDSVMELSVANHWADFKRTSGRRTNNTSQQHHFPLDMSMEFAPQTGDKLIWGDLSGIDPGPSGAWQGDRSTIR